MTKALLQLLEERRLYAHLTVEESVQAQGQARYEHGKAKYGATVDRKDLSFFEWLEHFKQELMDGVRYAERAQRDLETTGNTELEIGPQ